MEILQIIFFVQRSKGLKLHKPLVLQRRRTNNVTYGLSLIENYFYYEFLNNQVMYA